MKGDASGRRHIFCPNSTVTAQLSTCGSNFRTSLYINGSDIEYACVGGACYSFASCSAAETTLNFRSGECYDIIVGGISEWDEGEYSLSVTCTSITASNITCPTYLWDGELLNGIRDFAHPLIVWGSSDEAEQSFTGPESPLVNHSQVILANAFRIGVEVRDRLVDGLIGQSIHLLVFEDIQNIRDITGWSLEQAFCPQSAALQMQGGGFSAGPNSLPSRYRSCVQREELPANTDGLYGSASVAAWTAPYEKGRITYYASSFSESSLTDEWRQLIASSIGLVCAGEVVVRTGNSSTTTTTPVPVVCGSVVSGTIVQGGSLNDGFKKHTFCTPEETNGLGLGEVLFSTCGSSIDTSLTVTGPSGERWQCTNCGRCGQKAELKVSSLGSSRCYDVTVYSSGTDTGNYSLWVSCCQEELCSGNGLPRHTAWGPPMANATGFDLCRCSCRWPFTGTACDQCNEYSLSVPIAGACANCFSESSIDFYRVALENSIVTWSPSLLHPECDTIRIRFEEYSSTIAIRTEYQNGSLAVFMGSCPFQNLYRLSGWIVAGARQMGRVICVPKFTCDFEIFAGASLDFSPDNRSVNGTNLVSMQILTLHDERVALAALAVLELLASFNSSRSATLHDRFRNSLRFSLSSVSEAQQFLNNVLQSEPSQDFCVNPADISLPAVDPETELVVLLGRLCGSRQEIQSLMRPVLQRGRSIILLGEAGELPEFMTKINIRVSEVADQTCTYFTAWLQYRSNAQCVETTDEVTFSPLRTTAYRRSVLEFPGLCSIASCCVGVSCSGFLLAGPTASCYTPLLESGDYNVSVIFKNGTRAFAKHRLQVQFPLQTSSEPQRYVSSPNRLSGVFSVWTREVRFGAPFLYLSDLFDRTCCDLVAIGFDLTVMGRLKSKVCGERGFSTTVTLPEIEDENAFPQPVRFFAWRCFADVSQALVDGSSCSVPQPGQLPVAMNALSAAGLLQDARDQLQTWNLQRRIDQYVDSLHIKRWA